MGACHLGNGKVTMLDPWPQRGKIAGNEGGEQGDNGALILGKGWGLILSRYRNLTYNIRLISKLPI